MLNHEFARYEFAQYDFGGNLRFGQGLETKKPP